MPSVFFLKGKNAFYIFSPILPGVCFYFFAFCFFRRKFLLLFFPLAFLECEIFFPLGRKCLLYFFPIFHGICFYLFFYYYFFFLEENAFSCFCFFFLLLFVEYVYFLLARVDHTLKFVDSFSPGRSESGFSFLSATGFALTYLLGESPASEMFQEQPVTCGFWGEPGMPSKVFSRWFVLDSPVESSGKIEAWPRRTSATQFPAEGQD